MEGLLPPSKNVGKEEKCFLMCYFFPSQLKKRLFCPQQRGYPINKSTIKISIKLIENITNAIGKFQKFCAVSLDLSKAFYYVDSDVFIKKLERN